MGNYFHYKDKQNLKIVISLYITMSIEIVTNFEVVKLGYHNVALNP